MHAAKVNPSIIFHSGKCSHYVTVHEGPVYLAASQALIFWQTSSTFPPNALHILIADSYVVTFLEGQEEPEVAIHPGNSLLVDSGSSAVFQCWTVRGTPTPVVSWSRCLSSH
jgi:hypothetical protein